MKTTEEILKAAKHAAKNIYDTKTKNQALANCASCLVERTNEILKANAIDLKNAQGKLSKSMIDRLMLNQERIAAMADGILAVAKLPDPVGRELEKIERPNGLTIKKVSVPIGVVSIIYESRPNVTSDAAALCFKSGNVCVLRSGKDAFNSANAIVDAFRQGLSKSNIDEDYINLIEDTSRNSANELMTANGFVDLLIPRGGKGLIKACTENATVPCIETGTGICHIYVDETANIDMALNIINNAKTSRPSVCNAAEVLLVNKKAANELLPRLYNLFNDKNKPYSVELRGDAQVCKIINATPTNENDFDTEFLDYIMAVKVVDGIDEAIEHISLHSTHHSECIISNDINNISKFTASIDSAAVYVNASTRFTDGGEFGLGCEMGISTQKLHARGPMGLNELNTYKYIIQGNGQIR